MQIHHAGAGGFTICMLRNLLIAGVWFTAACLGQTGVVKSEGQPIPGATVKATQGDRILTTLTDQSGAFQFNGMTPGEWIVEVDMFGFDRARKEIQIGSNPTKIDFTLQLRDRTRGGPERGQTASPELNASEAIEGPAGAVEAEPVPGVPQDGSNESFLVNGSVSQGLQTQPSDMRPTLADSADWWSRRISRARRISGSRWNRRACWTGVAGWWRRPRW